MPERSRLDRYPLLADPRGWAEGDTMPEIGTMTRCKLSPAGWRPLMLITDWGAELSH